MPSGPNMENREANYMNILLEPIRVCASYVPKFGQGGSGLVLEEFQDLYNSDPFYSWFGLQNPLVYAAHKAAGGITSVYRQIGIAGERLFRQVLIDELSLTFEQANWSYQVTTSEGKKRKLSLDGRIPFVNVANESKLERIRDWTNRAADDLGVDSDIAERLKGIVFEVRQGYKSKDSKRQNADISNATNAYAHAYFPCVVVLSAQIDTDIQLRYRNAKWAILTGKSEDKSDLRSTYYFMKEILGFDLADFFVRNSPVLQREVEKVLKHLLQPE